MTDKTFNKYKLVVDEWFVNGFNGKENKNYGSKFYVYLLIDSTNSEIFYIGKGKGKRAESHLKEYLKGKISNHKKYSRIGNILSNNGDVIIYVVENNLTNKEACELEWVLIDSNRDILTNSQSGILSKKEKCIVWATEELKKIMPFDKWMRIKPRPEHHINLYHKNTKLLNDIINGNVIWH